MVSTLPVGLCSFPPYQRHPRWKRFLLFRTWFKAYKLVYCARYDVERVARCRLIVRFFPNCGGLFVAQWVAE